MVLSLRKRIILLKITLALFSKNSNVLLDMNCFRFKLSAPEIHRDRYFDPVKPVEKASHVTALFMTGLEKSDHVLKGDFDPLQIFRKVPFDSILNRIFFGRCLTGLYSYYMRWIKTFDQSYAELSPDWLS